MNPTASNKVQSIIERHDRGESVAAISSALTVSPGYVYGILRDQRPNRSRKPRTRTSEKRTLALGLHAQGIRPPRIAFLCGVTPAYVYKILDEESTSRS